MGRAVNAPGQARDHGHASFGQRPGPGPGAGHPPGTGPAAADDGQPGAGWRQGPAGPERHGIGQGGQQGVHAWVAGQQQAGTPRLGLLDAPGQGGFDPGQGLPMFNGDELLALLAAGHETTASTLAWAFERISRHPHVLERLVSEVAGEDNSYLQATIFEVQRNRTVIDFAGRNVAAPMYELGEWRLPQGFSILVSLLQLHQDPTVYPDPERFDPQRVLGEKPSTYSWVPFGGGTRRCVGAAFANMEMDVVLRTVLRHFTIGTTSAPGEKWHHRGVAFTPKNGGRVAVYRRAETLA